jgi:signal peptidase I
MTQAWACRTVQRLAVGLFVAGCAACLLFALALEPVQIATGSMAPGILGEHRACTCPRCGCAFPVGLHAADRQDGCSAGCYRKVFCPNCGLCPVPMAEAAPAAGDCVLVNKLAYGYRTPQRWEILLMRLFGTLFIKRLIALPHEEVLIRAGDVYIDGRLARKTLAQARAMRVAVFDDACPPLDRRWLGEQHLDGRCRPATLTYRHFLAGERKAEPISDEYSYNRGAHAGLEMVHDFLFEADVRVRAGSGALALRLCDGQDWVEVALPVGAPKPVAVRSWPVESSAATDLGCGMEIALVAGAAYRVEMALVDRRASLTVNGVAVVAVDLPEPEERRGVRTPVQFRVEQAEVDIRNFKLFRDAHYSQRGSHAVRERSVHLGSGQYFVLGDNSPDSHDSRDWPDRGRVGADCLVGPAWLTVPGSWLRAQPGFDR